MKKLIFLAFIAMSCSEDIKKYPIVCDVTVVKYKDGVLFSSKRENQNHYSEFTSEQFSKMMTSNNVVKIQESTWQYITNYECVDVKTFEN